MWPRRIPPDVLQNPLRSTEVEVFRKLERELDDSWWVFYSRPWLGLTPAGGEKDGECDFVVASAQRGMLCIEVKGGAVGWNPETDQWTSRDRHGLTHRIKDPVNQARTSKHELLAKLKKQRGFERRWIAVRHGVVLPDSDNPGNELGPDKPLRIFCFSDTYPRHLGDWVAARFQQDCGDTNEETLGLAGLHALRNLLARPFQLELSLGRVVRAEDREINYLTQQQFHLLEAISELPRVLIAGGAGTGKTVMAGRLAEDLAAAGKRTLLVCYNRPLADRLALQAKDVAGLTVQSFHQLCLSVIAQAGCAAPADSGARQTYFDETLPAAAEACASGDAVEKYDVIIVDEGQDFRDLWWLLIETLLKQDGQLRVFADNNQRVYGDVGRLKRDLQLAPIPLTWNLRNTKAIHEAAYRHYQGAPVRCDGPAGEAPQLVEVTDRSRVAGEVSKLVQSLTRQHDIAPDDVAVLVPNEAWREELSPGGRLAGFACADAARREDGKLVVDTVRRFKGLESLVTVIVADAALAANEELAYVALSRARTRTYLVGQSRHLNTVLASEEG
jgi:hypothetical protein